MASRAYADLSTISHKDKKILLQIWDTAGQERFKTVTSAYYRGADGIIIVFDQTDKESFNNIQNWIDDIKNQFYIMLDYM